MKEIKIKLFYKGFAILVAAFFCVTAFSQNAKDAKILYHQGLHLEEVKGELERAIAVYKQVVEQFPEERTITARAHLHIGICYEKLGKREAQKAYQLIIKEFADQKEVVSDARARLAALKKPPVPAEAKGMAVRKISSDRMMFPSVSPDGRYSMRGLNQNLCLNVHLASGCPTRTSDANVVNSFYLIIKELRLH